MKYPERVETARLVGERIESEHFDEIRLLNRDPLVMATLTADGRPMPDAATREGLERHVGHWERHGFGFWVFRWRDDGRFAGRGGLGSYELEGEEVVGLSYAVVPADWGKGLATEMARASVEAGFVRLGREWIGCWTLAKNAASLRVMEKLGFRYEKKIVFSGLEHEYFRLKEAWYKETL